MTACPIAGCNRTRQRGHVMCKPCWLTVPADLQTAVWAAYRARSRPGGMAAHLQAVENAHAAVEGRAPEDLFG